MRRDFRLLPAHERLVDVAFSFGAEDFIAYAGRLLPVDPTLPFAAAEPDEATEPLRLAC